MHGQLASGNYSGLDTVFLFWPIGAIIVSTTCTLLIVTTPHRKWWGLPLVLVPMPLWFWFLGNARHFARSHPSAHDLLIIVLNSLPALIAVAGFIAWCRKS
jgi:hypothetical protein